MREPHPLIAPRLELPPAANRLRRTRSRY